VGWQIDVGTSSFVLIMVIIILHIRITSLGRYATCKLADLYCQLISSSGDKIYDVNMSLRIERRRDESKIKKTFQGGHLPKYSHHHVPI